MERGLEVESWSRDVWRRRRISLGEGKEGKEGELELTFADASFARRSFSSFRSF